MNREQAKNTALAVCYRWHQQSRGDWHYREYGTKVEPWHGSISRKLAVLHFLSVIGSMTFMLVFLQIVDKNPRSLGMSDVNWFYVVSADLAATVFVYRSYRRTFQHDTRPS
jgi:hypothetical protein